MKLNTYQKTALWTVGSTLFLIFVGGLVRASGAGLGCPDWPKCFGMWMPPTSVADLPPQFDPSQFNVSKTWTEYLNRLVGVSVGLLITGTFLLSFRYVKERPQVFYASAAAMALVLVQGWLGGQVVVSGLSEWLITLHMLLAMVIVTVLLYAAFEATGRDLDLSIDLAPDTRRWLFWCGAGLLAVTLVQLVLGTQVREAVDVIKNSPEPPPREIWLDRVGAIDEVHRSFSWLVLLVSGALLYLGWFRAASVLIRNLATAIFGLVVFQTLLGVGLYYLGMPPAYQVFHLVGVAFLVCAEVLLLLLLWETAPSAVRQNAARGPAAYDTE